MPGERVSVQEVTYDLKSRLAGLSPLVAMAGWLPPDKILLARDGQYWLATITEIPGRDG